jgi:hypothetical protein
MKKLIKAMEELKPKTPFELRGVLDRTWQSGSRRVGRRGARLCAKEGKHPNAPDDFSLVLNSLGSIIAHGFGAGMDALCKGV